MLIEKRLSCLNGLNHKRTTLFCLLFLLCVAITFSQESNPNSNREDQNPIKYRKNELKIGVIKMIFVPMIDVEYERVFNRYASFGGTIAIGFNEDNYSTKFSISPFFRMYFTETKEYGSKGFFAQLFTGYYTGKQKDSSFINSSNYGKTFGSFGIGFGLGWKWINKGGFLMQITSGIVRTLSDTKVAPDVLFQGGIYLGYRF